MRTKSAYLCTVQHLTGWSC